MYVAIDKITKWPEVEAVRKVTTQSAVKIQSKSGQLYAHIDKERKAQ